MRHILNAGFAISNFINYPNSSKRKAELTVAHYINILNVPFFLNLPQNPLPWLRCTVILFSPGKMWVSAPISTRRLPRKTDPKYHFPSTV